MQRQGISRLLVTSGDELLGIVSLKDLLRFLDLKLEWEVENDIPDAAGAPEVGERVTSARW